MPSSNSPTMDNRRSLRAFFKELYVSRVWLLLFVRLLSYAGAFCSIPYIQTEVTEYFARKHTNEDISCTGPHQHEGALSGEHQLEACIQAHDDVLLWTTAKTVFKAVTVTLFLNPAVGSWSDMYGRKPFLILGLLAQLIPILSIYMYLKLGMPMELYYPAGILGEPFSTQSVMLAFIADLVTPENRLMAFGLLTLMLSIGIIVGMAPAISGIIPDLESASLIGIVAILIATAILIFFIPESLSKDVQHRARAAAKEKQTQYNLWSTAAFCWSSFASAMKILWRTVFFRKLVVILFLTMVVAEEYSEFRAQYLQEVLGFGTEQQSIMLMIMGVSGFLIMTVGLYIVSSVLKMKDKNVLLLGTSTVCFSYFLVSIATQAWMAYVSMALVSFWMFLGMAISSMKSRNVEESEQGAVQGALTAVSGLGYGLGPLVFFALYYAFRNGAIYFPPAPFYFGTFLMFIAVVIAATLKEPVKGEDSEVSQMKEEERELLITETAEA